jgi:hypothetical protein
MLFVALVLSVAAALPLAGTAFVSLSFFGFMLSLGGLAWWVIRADRIISPRGRGVLAFGSWEEGWESFESDFWAHVAEQEMARDSD